VEKSQTVTWMMDIPESHSVLLAYRNQLCHAERLCPWSQQLLCSCSYHCLWLEFADWGVNGKHQTGISSAHFAKHDWISHTDLKGFQFFQSTNLLQLREGTQAVLRQFHPLSAFLRWHDRSTKIHRFMITVLPNDNTNVCSVCNTRNYRSFVYTLYM
jgi:hypothetical protein